MPKPKITIKNIWSRIDGLNEIIIEALDKELSYIVPDAHFAMQHTPWWDGRVRLSKKIKNNKESLDILTGLTARTIKFLYDKFKITVDLEDTRIKPTKELDLKWNEDKYKLRDYQEEAVKNSLAKGRGVIEASTGSGKTCLASKIIQELGVKPFIFYVMSKELLYQAKNRLEESILGLEVGVIGDGNCDIKDINIMTVQTAYAVYGYDIKKDLKKNEDFDDDDFKSLKEENMSHVEKSIYIKKLIEDCKGIYYDECLINGTYVIMSDGTPVFIENVVDGYSVFSGGTISNKFEKKVKNIFEIEHQCNTLKTTTTHRNFAIRLKNRKKNRKNKYISFKSKDVEIIKSNNLNVGDFLLCPINLPHDNNVNNNLNYNMARLISTIMCDGHVDRTGHRIKINISKDKNWFRDVFYSASDDFKIKEIKEKIDRRGNLIIYTNDRNFKKTLTETYQIPKGNKANIIFVNEYFFKSSLETIRGFIDGCFCSEGDVSRNRLTICSISEIFINNIQTLLLKFGIISTIRKKHGKSNIRKTRFLLSITGKFIDKYIDKIGISMERKLLEAKNMVEKRSCVKETRKILFNGEEYYLSKIKKINNINGDFKVYDFTTETHQFIANNTLTHNCHHTGSKTTNDIIKKSTNCYYFFGGSATPIRTDNADLYIEGLFGRKICNISASFLIRKGYLMKPDIYYIRLQTPPIKAINFDQDLKENIVNNIDRNNHIASIATSLAESDLSVLILVSRIEHGEILKDLIKDAVFIYSKSKNRKEVLEDLESKKTCIVISSAISDEGLDLPTLNCVILAGGGKSQIKCKQRVGRAIRKTSGKTCSMIFDFLDVGPYTKRHSRARKRILESEPEFNIMEISSFEKTDFNVGKNLF